MLTKYALWGDFLRLVIYIVNSIGCFHSGGWTWAATQLCAVYLCHGDFCKFNGASFPWHHFRLVWPTCMLYCVDFDHRIWFSPFRYIWCSWFQLFRYCHVHDFLWWFRSSISHYTLVKSLAQVEGVYDRHNHRMFSIGVFDFPSFWITLEKLWLYVFSIIHGLQCSTCG